MNSMNLLTGIQNLLQYVNDNWTAIIIIIGLGMSLLKKIVDYLNKTDEEKIEIAKAQIKESILKLVTDAEEDYKKWSSCGSIKRSQVIEEIFLKYPILSKVSDQDSLIIWIDEAIDQALQTMRSVFENNAVKD